MTPDELYIRFDGVFFEKTRLSMLTLLYKETRVTFNRFKKILGGSDGALYSHLKKLAEAGYVDSKKTISGGAVATQYSLAGKGRDAFRDYLAFLETVLAGRKKGPGKSGGQGG
ncbi:MAG: transcriptional regulator [Spirochaetales bacterium]|nr:transcriptional regulator [Spirochaetales bacterium]